MSRWFLMAVLGCSNTAPAPSAPIVPVAATTTTLTRAPEPVAPVEPTFAASPTLPALPAMTRETFDEVVEDTLAEVFETCITAHPTKPGADHSIEVGFTLLPGHDPVIDAPLALPTANPALEDCLVDQLVQVELPAYSTTSELEFTYKIKERADGSKVRIFSTMEVAPTLPVQSS